MLEKKPKIVTIQFQKLSFFYKRKPKCAYLTSLKVDVTINLAKLLETVFKARRAANKLNLIRFSPGLKQVIANS